MGNGFLEILRHTVSFITFGYFVLFFLKKKKVFGNKLK